MIYTPQLPYLGVAQLGRALPWGGRGRWFKSSHSDQRNWRYCGNFRNIASLVFVCQSLSTNIVRTFAQNKKLSKQKEPVELTGFFVRYLGVFSGFLVPAGIFTFASKFCCFFAFFTPSLIGLVLLGLVLISDLFFGIFSPPEIVLVKILKLLKCINYNLQIVPHQ